MSEKLQMPEIIEGELTTAIRRTRKYDQEIFNIATQYRGKFAQHLHWTTKVNAMEDVINFSDLCMKNWDEGKSYAYIILNKEGTVVGSIEVHTIDYKHSHAEFAFWLSPDETGKGYISTTLTNIEKILFDQEMVRLVIRSNVDNLPSNGVAIKNGYALEGTLRKIRYRNGRFLDYNLYAKVNPAFDDTL